MFRPIAGVVGLALTGLSLGYILWVVLFSAP